MENMEGRTNNGKFKAGHSGFKPKGSTNDVQKVTKEKLGEFLLAKLDDLPTIYEDLNSREKAKLLMSISDYFLPKQKEITIDTLDAERKRTADLFPEELSIG